MTTEINKPKRGRRRKGLIVAVDFGNGRTKLAWSDGRKHVEIIVDADGNLLSMTAFALEGGDRDKPLYGMRALNYLKLNPEYVCTFAKRARGRNDVTAFTDTAGKVWTTRDTIVAFLKWRLDSAQELLGEEIKGVVATVPAHFNDEQRRDTERTFEEAGYPAVGIVAESSAACLHAASGKNGIYLIADLGAGTFDVSIVQVDEGNRFTILGTAGREDLGGREYTSRVTNHILNCCKKLGIEIDVTDLRSLCMAENLAEEAKIDLSAQTKTMIVGSLAGQLFDLELTRDELDKMTGDLSEDMVSLVQEAMQRASLTPDDINGVIFVGGGNRLGIARERVENLFDSDRIMRDVNPDTAVVMGAVEAIGLKLAERIAAGDVQLKKEVQAQYLQSDITLQEVAGQALGVQAVRSGTKEELLSEVVPQGTALPAKMTRLFGLENAELGTGSATIHILEGVADMPAHEASKLASFVMKDLPPGQSENRIEVTFDTDTNGKTDVMARDVVHGIEISGEAQANSVSNQTVN